MAELAAAGMSNREIAAALFITAKTVDVNLYRVYRKLDIQVSHSVGQGGWTVGAVRSSIGR